MKLPFRESEENWPDISANSGPPIVSHRWLSFVYKKTIMAVYVQTAPEEFEKAGFSFS